MASSKGKDLEDIASTEAERHLECQVAEKRSLWPAPELNDLRMPSHEKMLVMASTRANAPATSVLTLAVPARHGELANTAGKVVPVTSVRKVEGRVWIS